MVKFAPHLHSWKTKCFQLQGGALPPDPLTRGSVLDPTGGSRPDSLPDPIISSQSALAMSPHFYEEVYAYAYRRHLANTIKRSETSTIRAVMRETEVKGRLPTVFWNSGTNFPRSSTDAQPTIIKVRHLVRLPAARVTSKGSSYLARCSSGV